PADEHNFDREEVACVLNWSYLYTQVRIVQAHKLVNDLPQTLAAVEAGAISADHARAVVDACAPLSGEQTAKVEKRVLDHAPEQTVTNLRRSLARAVKAVDRRGWDERHQQAVKHRDVAVTPQPDGMSGLWSLHTTADAEQMLAVLQQVANRDRGDGRLAGERR